MIHPDSLILDSRIWNLQRASSLLMAHVGQGGQLHVSPFALCTGCGSAIRCAIFFMGEKYIMDAHLVGSIVAENTGALGVESTSAFET